MTVNRWRARSSNSCGSRRGQVADQDDRVSGVDVGADRARRAAGVEQAGHRVADRTVAVCREVAPGCRPRPAAPASAQPFTFRTSPNRASDLVAVAWTLMIATA